MNEIDYKKLFTEARKYFSMEWDYTKLTAVEKLAVLLSAVAFVAVVIIIGTFIMLYLFSALISVMATALGCTWGAHLIAAAILGVLLLVVFAIAFLVIRAIVEKARGVRLQAATHRGSRGAVREQVVP